MRYDIIAFSGLMGSGKTTASNEVAHVAKEAGYIPKLVKLAQPLYDMQKFIYQRARLNQPATKDRELLQYLGTNWGRSKNTDLWVDIWEMDAKTELMFGPPKTIVLVDDVRFNNEAIRIQEMGGAVININSSTESRSERIPLLGTSHESEQGINPKYITATVYNDKSLSSFLNNVRYVFETLQCGSSK